LESKAIFDQEQTLEIKKKNDYYENQLAMLDHLSTPAPVVGDISTMTDPLPGVRLPRIPYYEYIYYLMRWNSSVLRMIGFKIKQEIFRETRLKGFEWEGKFKTKCSDCGTEFEEQLEACEFCHSKNVVPPDPVQKKMLEPFLLQANKAEQTLLEVFEEDEDDFNTVDDAYLVFLKDYFIGPGGVFGKVQEIMRGDPSRFRIVSDISGRRGGKWWVCIVHRGDVMEPEAYNKDPRCSICGLPCQEVHYVETTPGGITPAKYYIEGEVVHASKYEPSRLYGIPPMFSVYIVARTIQLMDLYTEEYYEKGRLKGLLGIATENKVELKKWWDETMTRLRNDPHYVPLIALDVGPDNKRSRMEFVRLVDNMDELKFQEHRRMLKEEIAGLFGVNLIFLADTSTSGGLNNEGLQITVTDRTVEWGQSIYHDQFFPKILEYLNITDWKLKLKPSKETDEMAELERFDLRVDTAGKLQQMGYTIELRDDKFEVKGKAFIVDKPDPFGGQGGFGNTPSQQRGGNENRSSDVQEGKPEKAKEPKEIKRSLEKDMMKFNTGMTPEAFKQEMKALQQKIERIPSPFKRERALSEFYDMEWQGIRLNPPQTYNFYKPIHKWHRVQEKKVRAEIREREKYKSLEKADCRGRPPNISGAPNAYYPYYCKEVEIEYQFFVDKDKSLWFIGARDKAGKDISRWITTGEVKTTFGWFGVKLKDGRGKFKSTNSLMKVDEYTKLSVRIDELYQLQVVKQKELIGLDQELRPLERKKKRWQIRHRRASTTEAQDKILDDLRQLEHEINDVKGKMRNVNHEVERIDKTLNRLIISRSKLLKAQDGDNFDDEEEEDDLVDLEETTKNLPQLPQMQAFDMERVNDESGVSGTGIVLSGIIFQDGKVVIRWNSGTASTTVFDSWEDFEEIHINPHPGNETKIHFYQLTEGDMKDFAKAVVEPGKKVLADVKQIEQNFAKQLEAVYMKQLDSQIAKLDDTSSKRLIKEIDSIVNSASPIIEKLAFSEVLRAYKQGKKIDESREVSKTIDLPENLTEPFRAEYGAFGLDKADWQVLRAIYRRNPFWKAFEGMSQSVSDKLKEHITESYEAPNTSRMKATIRDVKRQYPTISKERAEIIAYGRIGKFSIAKVITMMKRTINAETYRLERIARSETTAITAKGREITFQQRDPEGLHKYRWFGPRDKRNSEECPEIKRRVAKEGKNRGVSLERLKEIQEEVVDEANKMRKTDWNYRDWLPHANCRHVIQRVV
jgi:hypothetical protein